MKIAWRRSIAAAVFAAVLLAVYPSNVFAEQDASDAGFRFAETDSNSLGLWEGERPVFTYRFGEIRLPGNPAAGTRSSYLHPIYGLDGETITDDFPADHYHHHGLFWGWPHVKIGGREYDLWKLRGIRIKFERWLGQDASATSAKLGVENGWYVRDKCVVKEQAWFTVHPATKDARSIDVRLSWTPTDEPVTLGGAEGKSYGGLTLRFAPRKGTVITTPNGQVTEDLLITKMPWADLSATFKDAPAPSGAAIFVHPKHPDFPPEWMTREYGVLAVGWPGVHAVTMEPGKTTTCQYRIWIHRGVREAGDIAKAYGAYAAEATKSK